MRVLLPLRKAPANTHASNSSLSDQSASTDLWIEDSEENGDAGHFVEETNLYQAEGETFSVCGDELIDNNPEASPESVGATAVPPEAATLPPPTASTSPSCSGSPDTPKQHRKQPPKQVAGFNPPSHPAVGTKGALAVHTEASVKPAPPSRSSKDPPTKVTPRIGVSSTEPQSCSKRKPLEESVEPDQASKKARPAPDAKPPPVQSQTEALGTSSSSAMVGGRRVASSWRYNDDDRRDSPVSSVEDNGCFQQQQQILQHRHVNEDPLENNPESARGDLPATERQAAVAGGDLNFLVALKKRGLEIREQEGDGNCLFRAISLQVYGDPSMHGQIRKQCMDFMVSDVRGFAICIP